MEINVIKVGGAILENPDSCQNFLHRFASVEGAKILVHGGGRSATAMAARLGIETKMAEGRRITDKPMLEVVTMVYGGLVNKSVVAGLQTLGVNAIGLTGADLCCIRAHKRPVKEIDYGFVGDVGHVKASAFLSLLDSEAVPVVAPLTYDPENGLLNTNADTVATEIAKALSSCCRDGFGSGTGNGNGLGTVSGNGNGTGSGSGNVPDNVTLTFCFEKPGVLSEPDNDESVIRHMDSESYSSLKASGVISGGMVPKLDNAFAALRSGVSKVVITNASDLYGNKGTEIVL